SGRTARGTTARAAACSPRGRRRARRAPPATRRSPPRPRRPRPECPTPVPAPAPALRRGSTRPPRSATPRRSAPAGSSPRPRRGPRSRDPPDHGAARRLGHDRAEADPEVEDPPQLLLVHVAAQPAEHLRPFPPLPVELGTQALRHDAREVALDPAAGDV